MTSTTIHSRPDVSSSPWPAVPPTYTKCQGDIELTSWTSQSPNTAQEPPSDFIEVDLSTSAAAPFTPTSQLQIQTRGKALHCLPTPTRPDPVPVFSLTPDGHIDRPLYLSLRPKRSSGSCFLVHGDDETETPLSTTTYIFGPCKPPVVCLKDAVHAESEESFQIQSMGLFTRSQSLRTSLGMFEWRYGSSNERAVEGADNLLILERVVVTGNEGGTAAKGDERRTRIAQLVRNRRYRTPGTCRSNAGNGGRLMLDLREVDEKQRESMQVLVVTTAISMLKKEVDRRRRDGPYSIWWI